MPDETPVNTSRPHHSDVTPADTQSIRNAEMQRLVRAAGPFLDLADQPRLPDGTTPASAQPFQFSELSTGRQIPTLADFPDNAEVQIEIELGHAQCSLDDQKSLRPGSLVPLSSLSSEPVDIFADGRLAARGEIVTLADQPGIRIVEIL